MSAIDDDKLLAKLAELRRRRAEAAKIGDAPAARQAGPAAEGERGARLRALREKRGAASPDGGNNAAPGGAGEGQRGALLRRLMAKRGDGAGQAGGAQAGGNRGAVLRRLVANKKDDSAPDAPGDGKGRGALLKRIMARRQGGEDGAGPKAPGSGDGDLVRLLMRRLTNEGNAAVTPEDKQKAREKIEKLIQELTTRLEQLDAQPAQAAAVHEGEILPPMRPGAGKTESKGSKRGGIAGK